MGEEELRPGLYEWLLTAALDRDLGAVNEALLHAEIGDLADAEASDRLSRHVASVLARTIESLPDRDRAALGANLAQELLTRLGSVQEGAIDADKDLPLAPPRVLNALLRRMPDGRPEMLETPLTPLLDTTLLTNSPGEPSIGYELKAEVNSADSIDVVMAFVRWSGIRPLMDALRRHCREGKPLRLVTTTYTNSTEVRSLDELAALGGDIRVSYDVTSTRLHAKAWHFHRASGYSTAYIGSSNLTHSAQITGLEWNVRVSGARNPDVVAKMAAVFEAYWANGDFIPFDHDEFVRRTAVPEHSPTLILSPIEIELRPFQQRLLEQVELARSEGRHRNLLVAATGTGKTVMAAVDYSRLRSKLPRDRLLFVAHREEILDQSRATFQHALRDPAFGEKWVGGQRPVAFEHVFASIQSLSRSGLEALDPAHFDVVIVDEFHHAAAPSYRQLFERIDPVELLGLTATPERADDLDVLHYFDGQIAAELRIWDAIDQQYLVPFSYFGIHDGTDLRDVPWRRGTGYDPNELTNVLTADHVWARQVVEQLRRTVADVGQIRALGFCVTVTHARFMAKYFTSVGIPSVAVWGDSPENERRAALADLAAGRVNVVFTVDLFNEGIDVPNVDTLLMLRPTESPTLFLQQLGRGLRPAPEKAVCTVLDFVGHHRKEFRFDRRFRALLGGSRRDVERQIEAGFPFLPSGCHFELDRVAREIVLRSIREAIPSEWRAKCQELRALGDVRLGEYLTETGLDLDDVYTANHSWTELRRASGLRTASGGPDEPALLRAVGRLLHVDDHERLNAYRELVGHPSPPELNATDERDRRLIRMLVSSMTTLGTASPLDDALNQLWANPSVLDELREMLDLLDRRVDHLGAPLGIDAVIPLQVHARYTRAEILAAFAVGEGARPPTWQTGVWWNEHHETDLFAFTLDKSAGSFSPTTRYRDYAISPSLIHWESQGTTSLASDVGQRYVTQREQGTNVVLFARLSTSDRGFWCLGPATHVRHEGERPIAITWQLDHSLPGDLFAAFAAAVA
jgi:superfamily II DNA or RNA helicase